MTTFNRFDAGTSADAWLLDDVGLLPVPYPGDRVVLLAAHPDDETLGAGGLIAALARRGVELTVVIATDGEASHPNSPTRTPGELATLRRAEVRAALGVLAPRLDPIFLALPDGALEANEAELTKRLSEVAGQPTHVVSPWTGDRHPDHEACGRAAARLASDAGARHWQYPIWAWHWADPNTDELPTDQLLRLALTDEDAERKTTAIACYRSQHSALSDRPGDEAILAPSLLAHFTRTTEYFFAAGGSATSASSFDTLYASSSDPWELQSAFYEQRKRDVEFASLPRRRFHRAFEPGCALGLLTHRLADRCDEVIAWDVAPSALDQARARLADRPNVVFDQRSIPDEWPPGVFDLIVLSEVGYYCVDLDHLVTRVAGSLGPDGVLLACHWRWPAPDHPHTAEAVHLALRDVGLHEIVIHTERDFLLHVWGRTPTTVAQRDGIVP